MMADANRFIFALHNRRRRQQIQSTLNNYDKYYSTTITSSTAANLIVADHTSTTKAQFDDQMAPKPQVDDDLFIEPADDYDVVYGDFNSTMDQQQQQPSSNRPYIRLNSFLRNVTKDAGQAIKFKCEAAGSPLPLNFIWLKNHAPVEKSRRIKVRTRDFWSRLAINDLDVLDSGYYQCIVSNSVASVNTTGVLRVTHVHNSANSGRVTGGGNNKQSKISSNKLNNRQQLLTDEAANYDVDEDDETTILDDSNDDTSAAGTSNNNDRTMITGFRRDDDDDGQWSNSNDRINSPDTGGGAGFVADNNIGDRWLDGVTLRIGSCIEYRGDACRNYLAGQYVRITSANREDMLDIDRNLRAAMMFINNSVEISSDCKRHSHAVACYHMYKVCERASPRAPSNIAICKRDCERLQMEVCPKELELAAKHDLVGDGPKALLPSCSSLQTTVDKCIPILESPPSSSSPTTNRIDNNIDRPREHLTHWCYIDSGKTYQGAVSATKTGKTCLPWSKSSSREFNVEKYPSLRSANNYCRNPGGHKTSPWCYAAPNGQEEYCEVLECPKNMYPHLRDSNTGSDGNDAKTRSDTNASTGLLSDMNSFWQSLSTHWQYSILAGAGLFILFMLLLCCLCCCRRRRQDRGKRALKCGSSIKAGNGGAQNSCNGSLLMNSATNGTAYYRQLNGGGSANQSNAAFELSSLLLHQQQQLHPNGGIMISQPNRPSPRLTDATTNGTGIDVTIHEISTDRLQIGDVLGEGQFGKVHNGYLYGEFDADEPMQVAIKTLNDDVSINDRSSFMHEVLYMAPLKHPNVVRLLGVVTNPATHQLQAAVFEFMLHGDLHNFLKLRAPIPSSMNGGIGSYEQQQPMIDKERITSDHQDFLNISTQISCGMEYLSGMNFVHRDLAARNCLMRDRMVIKIADFGLMRSCYEKDYYQMTQRTWMPVRWMSKEALQFGKFSEASDVWAFGVTLWEIYSYGRQPYEGYPNGDVIAMITGRDLLECPANCPPSIYSLMVECWHENADRRPSFAEIHHRLQGWQVLSPVQSAQHPSNRAGSSSHSGSSSAAAGPNQQLGSRQSSSTGAHSTSLIGLRSQNFAPVPSPAPVVTNNGTGLSLMQRHHPYHHLQQQQQHQPTTAIINHGRSPKIRSNNANSTAAAGDASPLMRRTNYVYSEDGESD